MIFFPAIDLKDAKCVRLYQGDMNKATIFNNDPASQALEFEKLGFKYLHLVDLDGAINGKVTNEKAIKNILKNITIPVQLGGGIRSIADIEKVLSWGVNRVILGTIALKNPILTAEACKKFPQKIVIGIDAKNQMVSTQGWVEDSQISCLELAKKLEDCGAFAIIYTDIARDGTLGGFDFNGTKNLISNVKIPIIASGGINNNDITSLKLLNNLGLFGAIIGKALYEKQINLSYLI